MRDKILSALKTKFKTLGFGDKAFDGVADFLSKTVTKEDEVETAIAGVEPLLKAFQGDIDKRVQTFKTELDDLKKKTKTATSQDDDKTQDDQSDIQKQIAAAIKAAVEPLQQKLEGYDKRETQTKLQTKALSSIRDGFKTDTEKKSFDIWMKGRTIQVEDENKLDETVEGLKTQFSEFRQEMIDQNIIPDIPANPGASGEASSIDDYLDDKFGKVETIQK